MERYIEELLTRLTLEEKIGMIHGATLFRTAPVDRLGIPSLCFSDGPMGVRAEFADAEWRELNHTDDFVTYLPCNSAVASTWNRALAESSGDVLGAEARGRGKDVILAPGINIKRTPLCGRNFEYMSEDPYLIQELVVPMVKGIQRHVVAACVKHFAANSQETQRLSVDAVVEERALQEIYYPGFRAAVEGGLYSIMGAYNRLNGEHCCTGKKLLNDVLRQDWGFDGLVVSDWGGVHDTRQAAEASIDVEMGVTGNFDQYFLAQPLLEQIRSGELPESLVDEKIRNILRLMLRLKMIGPEKEKRSAGAYNTHAHRTAAQAVAEESVILLKNSGNVLPLAPEKVKKVAVIGGNAITRHSLGGGSAEIKALYEITPLMGIKKYLGGNAQVCYLPGYGLPELGARPEISWQASSTQNVQQRPKEPKLIQADLDAALKLAQESDAVIFVGGLNHDYDVEGLDRRDMKLPYGQDEVIGKLLQVRPDTVVVLYAGSPVEMPWLSRASTVLWSYYAGMEGGTALANILFGEVNPSGKLAESFIKSAEQCPAAIETDRAVYSDGVFVGYRHYDKAGTDLNFCFGHGLSYTTFAYRDLAVKGREVSFAVKNTGAMAGKETVQLYIAGKEMQQLRHFEKLALMPGEEKTVRFTLTERDFAAYDVEKRAFCTVPGEYEIRVGASSRDIRLTARMKIGKE